MKLTVIKWRDIPTQVMIKKSRREVEKVQLENRFMEAVDCRHSWRVDRCGRIPYGLA